MKKGRAFLAFLAPLFLGAATLGRVRAAGLTLPPLYGSGIGLFVSFALVTPLVRTGERRAPLATARARARRAGLVQLVIACSSTVAAVKLRGRAWCSAPSLEVILAVTAAIGPPSAATSRSGFGSTR